MELTDKQLDDIERYAAIFMPIKQIAQLIGVYQYELREEIRNTRSEAAKRYHKAKLEASVKLHEQEMNLALIGAPQAIENAKRNLMDMEDDE